MSRAMAETPKTRRPRRRFDDDFKQQAVRLVLDEGKSVGAVARDLDLTETALRGWVKRAPADRTNGRTGLTTAEREELARLRKENRILREEREILKKAAAFFANEPRGKFAVIAAEKEHHALGVLCRCCVWPAAALRWAAPAGVGRAKRDGQQKVLMATIYLTNRA